MLSEINELGLQLKVLRETHFMLRVMDCHCPCKKVEYILTLAVSILLSRLVTSLSKEVSAALEYSRSFCFFCFTVWMPFSLIDDV